MFCLNIERSLVVVAALIVTSLSVPAQASPAPFGVPDPMQTTIEFGYAPNFLDMSIVVNNAMGDPVMTPLTVTVAHATGSAGLTLIGPVFDVGKGAFTLSLSPTGGTGTDIFEVTIDDGINVVTVTPNPSVCVGDIAGGLSDDCNGNSIPDECEIAEGLVPDANNNGLPDDCESFRRGDCNVDTTHDFFDVLHILNFMYGDNGLNLECEDACDADDNSRVDVHDAVALAQALFLAGPGIAVPFPGCGLDPTADNLPCDTYSICP